MMDAVSEDDDDSPQANAASPAAVVEKKKKRNRSTDDLKALLETEKKARKEAEVQAEEAEERARALETALDQVREQRTVAAPAGAQQDRLPPRPPVGDEATIVQYFMEKKDTGWHRLRDVPRGARPVVGHLRWRDPRSVRAARAIVLSLRLQPLGAGAARGGRRRRAQPGGASPPYGEDAPESAD